MIFKSASRLHLEDLSLCRCFFHTYGKDFISRRTAHAPTKLRTRQQNTETTVPLDVVKERRTHSRPNSQDPFDQRHGSRALAGSN